MKQAALPVSFGGLGLRKLSDLALPCSLSSLHFCLELVESVLPSNRGLTVETDIVEATQEWKDATGLDETPDLSNASKQKAWDEMRSEQLRTSLIDQGSQLDRCRLLAASKAESGAWLHATPVPTLGTHLSAPTLRTAIAFRVGATVAEAYECECGSPADWLGSSLH